MTPLLRTLRNLPGRSDPIHSSESSSSSSEDESIKDRGRDRSESSERRKRHKKKRKRSSEGLRKKKGRSEKDREEERLKKREKKKNKKEKRAKRGRREKVCSGQSGFFFIYPKPACFDSPAGYVIQSMYRIRRDFRFPYRCLKPNSAWRPAMCSGATSDVARLPNTTPC